MVVPDSISTINFRPVQFGVLRSEIKQWNAGTAPEEIVFY